MIKALYEKVTGTPWTTGRSIAADFGPTVAARYAAELAPLSDRELMAMMPEQAIAYGEAVKTRENALDETCAGMRSGHEPAGWTSVYLMTV